MMTMQKFEAGQIWIAYVHFADKPEVGKVRPVIVLDANAILDAETELKVSVCRVTSRPFTGDDDIFVEEWESCGLVKPSCVRADIVFEILQSDILSEAPIGKVNEETLAEVLTKIQK